MESRGTMEAGGGEDNDQQADASSQPVEDGVKPVNVGEGDEPVDALRQTFEAAFRESSAANKTSPTKSAEPSSTEYEESDFFNEFGEYATDAWNYAGVSLEPLVDVLYATATNNSLENSTGYDGKSGMADAEGLKTDVRTSIFPDFTSRDWALNSSYVPGLRVEPLRQNPFEPQSQSTSLKRSRDPSAPSLLRSVLAKSGPKMESQSRRASQTSFLFKCEYDGCTFVGRTAQDLRHHSRIHIPMERRPHGCPHCHQRFLSPRELERHLTKHGLGDRYYCHVPTCHYATKGFGRRDHLTRHKRSKHATNSMEQNPTSNSAEDAGVKTTITPTKEVLVDFASPPHPVILTQPNGNGRDRGNIHNESSVSEEFEDSFQANAAIQPAHGLVQISGDPSTAYGRPDMRSVSSANNLRKVHAKKEAERAEVDQGIEILDSNAPLDHDPRPTPAENYIERAIGIEDNEDENGITAPAKSSTIHGVFQLSGFTDEGYSSGKYSVANKDNSVLGISQAEGEAAMSVMDDGLSFALPTNIKERLISILAIDLLHDLNIKTQRQRDLLQEALPAIKDLLKEFSFLTEVRVGTLTELKATRFARRYRTRIVQHLEGKLQEHTARDKLPGGQVISCNEKIEAWVVNIDHPDGNDPYEPGMCPVLAEAENNDDLHDEDLDDDGLNDEDIFDISDIPTAPEARNFLLDSEEYDWLLSSIKRLLSMSSTTAMSNLRAVFIDSLSLIKRNGSNSKLDLKVDLDWSPFLVTDENMEPLANKGLLESVITISGPKASPLAMTCADYMKMLWPTLGYELLKCVQNAAISELQEARLDAGDTKIHLKCANGRTVLQAEGPIVPLLQLFEAFAWLGTACRPSPDSLHFGSCSPQIARSENEPLSFSIEFLNSKFETNNENSGGSATCWHKMFRNPVLARDYPVPRRESGEEGLELSLELLVTLGQTFWATTFGGFLLKGFNSIAAPVKRIGNSVIWHFLVHMNGDHMSYGDAKQHALLPTLAEAIFDGARHFVGWAAHTESLAGTLRANYDNIKPSGCFPTSAGISAEAALSISGGKFINFGFKIVRGSKDTPEYLRGDFYGRQIYSAALWGVVLTDTANSCHWLVDGATAILHLCLASFSPKLVPWATEYAGKAKQIQFSRNVCAPDAACETLMDRKNRRLRLTVEKSETTTKQTTTANGEVSTSTEVNDVWYCLEDLVRQMYFFLEQIRERTVDMRRHKDTIDLQIKRRVIVGFDFKDLLVKNGPIAPLSRHLEAGARDWLDLAIKLDTINLFGSNFGELIRPCARSTRSPRLCGIECRMPEGRDYLAVSLSTLEKITSDRCRHVDRALQIADDLYLPDPESYFAKCECGYLPSCRCSAIVKTLLDRPCSEVFKSTHSVFQQYRYGGYIFAHHPEVLTKGARKRRAEIEDEPGKRSKRDVSDSAIDVGSSGTSNSLTPSEGSDEGNSPSNWLFRGAASGRQ